MQVYHYKSGEIPQVGDIVMIHDKSQEPTIKEGSIARVEFLGEYTIGIADEDFPSNRIEHGGWRIHPMYCILLEERADIPLFSKWDSLQDENELYTNPNYDMVRNNIEENINQIYALFSMWSPSQIAEIICGAAQLKSAKIRSASKNRTEKPK
jgi:hypothetical protein